MKRVLALAAAGLLIAGAFLLRSALDDDDDGGGDGPPTASSGGDEVRLTCDTLLEDVCAELAATFDDLEVTVAPGPETLDRLADSADDPETDGWLTVSPLPEMSAENRDRGGLDPLLDDPIGPLARSPLVVAVWNDRAEVLTTACGVETIDWRCIGDHAGEPWADLGGDSRWGRVKPGLDDPARSTIGLLTLGQVATAWFGSRDFASNDFADPGFRAWLTDLADAVPTFAATRGTPLDQMLAAGPSAYDLVGSTEAEGGPAIAGSRDSDRLGISYAGPMTTADVVLVTLRGSDRADRLSEIASSEQAAEILADAGWRVEGFPSAGHVADIELPDDNGLPRPGVLEALRQL